MGTFEDMQELVESGPCFGTWGQRGRDTKKGDEMILSEIRDSSTTTAKIGEVASVSIHLQNRKHKTRLGEYGLVT